jgi:hypothetical protein
MSFCTAQAFIDAGASVTVASSSNRNVDWAVERPNLPANASGRVGSVLDEDGFVEVSKSLAPVDIVFSGLDKMIRWNLEELDLEDAKCLFGSSFGEQSLLGWEWYVSSSWTPPRS